MDEVYEQQRERMVQRQLAGRGIRDARVLAAMGAVPRERFVPRRLRPNAYEDGPLPIGLDQTISQPYVVALMAELLCLRESDRVLEVGTGSGYAAAVLSKITRHVYTVERHKLLADQAVVRLEREGCANITVRHGNGYAGWEEHAPFEAIMVSAGAAEVPPALMEQLTIGGRMVLPLGKVSIDQRLNKIWRTSDKHYEQQQLSAVSFVPLIDAG